MSKKSWRKQPVMTWVIHKSPDSEALPRMWAGLVTKKRNWMMKLVNHKCFGWGLQGLIVVIRMFLGRMQQVLGLEQSKSWCC